jgi:hypothetical protein
MNTRHERLCSGLALQDARRKLALACARFRATPPSRRGAAKRYCLILAVYAKRAWRNFVQVGGRDR